MCSGARPAASRVLCFTVKATRRSQSAPVVKKCSCRAPRHHRIAATRTSRTTRCYPERRCACSRRAADRFTHKDTGHGARQHGGTGCLTVPRKDGETMGRTSAHCARYPLTTHSRATIWHYGTTRQRGLHLAATCCNLLQVARVRRIAVRCFCLAAVSAIPFPCCCPSCQVSQSLRARRATARERNRLGPNPYCC